MTPTQIEAVRNRLRAIQHALTEKYDVHDGCMGEVGDGDYCAKCDQLLTVEEIVSFEDAEAEASRLVPTILQAFDQLATIVPTQNEVNVTFALVTMMAMKGASKDAEAVGPWLKRVIEHVHP